MDTVSENVADTASRSIEKYTLENMSCFVVGLICTLVFIFFSMISGCWSSLSWSTFGVSILAIYVLTTGTCWYMQSKKWSNALFRFDSFVAHQNVYRACPPDQPLNHRSVLVRAHLCVLVNVRMHENYAVDRFCHQRCAKIKWNHANKTFVLFWSKFPCFFSHCTLEKTHVSEFLLQKIHHDFCMSRANNYKRPLDQSIGKNMFHHFNFARLKVDLFQTVKVCN